MMAVAPHAGARIETLHYRMPDYILMSLPMRERELKLRDSLSRPLVRQVSLPMREREWKPCCNPICAPSLSSLPMRSAN